MKNWKVRVKDGLVEVPGREIKIDGLDWDLLATRPLQPFRGTDKQVQIKEFPEKAYSKTGWVVTERNTGMVLLGYVKGNTVKGLIESFQKSLKDHIKEQFPKLLKDNLEKYGYANPKEVTP